MEKKEYIEKMKQHSEEFQKVMTNIVNDTIKFSDANPKVDNSDWDYLRNVDTFINEGMIQFAWVKDRIENKLGKRTSLKKKVRKILGYTYP
jgi:coenzyme F420-reducing hydrogenase alpha subunit